MGDTTTHLPATDLNTLETLARRWQRYNSTGRKSDAERTADQIVEALTPAINELSGPYIRGNQGGRTREEIFQTARIAAVEALPRYKPLAGGASFWTFVYDAIRFQLMKYTSREANGSPVHEPAGSRQARAKVRRAKEFLPDNATAEEIAEAAGMTPAQVIAAMEAENVVRPAVPICPVSGDGIDPEVSSLFGIDGTNARDAEILIREYLPKLPTAEQAVITRRFFEGHTLQEIGKSMGCTGENVRRIEEKALKRLRTIMTQPQISTN